MDKNLDIFYFSGTHWDREWYQDYQAYRYKLIKMVDKLINIFETDRDYETYHFDGQTIVLEDYTEICPEKKEKLKSFIKEGKILVGPWYVMPDEFLLSGESLIKNLSLGHKLAKEWGAEPWKYGYICDIFGHIAQMPQIFNGFDIKYTSLGRGTTETDPAYFRWKSPDGSECINFTLEPQNGYGSFNLGFYKKFEDRTINNPEIVKALKTYVDAEIKRSKLPVVVLMDALDHAEPSENTTDYIKKLNELYPNANVHHINLCMQGELIEKYKDELNVVEGELVKTAQARHGYLHLITNTLSSYYPIKKNNDECQNMLEKTIEPMLVMAKLESFPLNRSFVNCAYKHLLQNHPHDSICGCSIAQVHKDVDYRFDQVKEICNAIKTDYVFGSDVSRLEENEKDFENILVLKNLLPYDIDRILTVEFQFPQNYPKVYSEPFDHETINTFKIYDSDNNEIPYQIKNIKLNNKFYDVDFRTRNQYTVTFNAKIPSFGKSEYLIKPSNTPVRYLKKMTSGLTYAENKYIRFDINTNGSLKITNKLTGKVYDNLCLMNDDGEIGDGWFHVNEMNDFSVNSAGGGCTIKKVENGVSRVAFEIVKELDLPSDMVYNNLGIGRNEQTKKFVYKMTVGLNENSKYVDIKLNIDNNIKDHRLQMLLPTGIDVDEYFAGQAFYCCHRKVGIDYSTQDWRETDKYEKATNGIVGKRDEEGDGIAFVCANGIHECFAYDDKDGTIGVTLLRSFLKTVGTCGETRGQINIPLEYSFALAPIDKKIEYSDLLKVQDDLAVKPLTNFLTVKKGSKIEEPVSLLKIEGKNVCTSIIKKAENIENAVVIRVFNASRKNTVAKISTEFDIKKAELVNLNEEKIKEIPANKNLLEAEISPWKIQTYMLYI